MLHCHNPPRVHQLATGLPCSSSPCRRHSLQYDSMGPRSVCPASSCRPSLLDGGHGHSLLSTHSASLSLSLSFRRPSVSPTLRVVHALRRWRLWSSSMERLSLRLRPSLSPPSTFRFFPLVRVRVRVRHRHCRLNALCTSTHRLLTIMPRRRRAGGEGN